MEINRLLGDEITYELQIRGLPIGNTVEQKRNLLREALRKERLKLIQPPEKCNFSEEHELVTCISKLSELRLAIADFNFANRENEFRRIHTRLEHLSGRLRRLVCSSETDGRRNLLLMEVMDLVSELNRTYSEVPERVPETVLERNTQETSQLEARHDEGSLLDTPNDTSPRRTMLANREEASVSFDLVDVPPPPPSNKDLSHTTAQQPLVSNRCIYTISAPPPSWYLPDRYNPLGGSNVTFLHRSLDVDQNHNPTLENRWPNWLNLANQNDVHISAPQPTSKEPCDTYARAPVNHPANSSFHAPRSQNTRFDPDLHVYESYEVRPPYLDVGRWGVRYDGRGSVSEFLERIEELRASRGVSKDRLLQSAAELFTKEALLWYRTTRASSWDDLCNQLRDTFLPHDYEYGLWDEIRSRTQGTNEKVVNFVVVMESLFRKLREPVSEHTKVNIIQRNFLPYIQRQLALHPVTTVSQIMSMARSIEEAHVRAQRYQPPPSSVKGLLEPELRYRRTEGSAPSTNCLAASTPCTSGPNMEENISLASLTNSPARPEALCWNCHQTGHKFRKCQREKQIFCFRCGRRDVTSNSCPHCVQKNSRVGRQ
nr:unnamed protein product [Callosobruchus analis]